jgi:hypothetical protein
MRSTTESPARHENKAARTEWVPLLVEFALAALMLAAVAWKL